MGRVRANEKNTGAHGQTQANQSLDFTSRAGIVLPALSMEE
jgi:hypothetical protein